MFSPSLPDWASVSLVAALLLVLVGGFAARRMHTKLRHVTNALNHMTQGLCMFDRSARIIVCNQQYLRIYQLSPQVVKPGCTLRDLPPRDRIVHRRSGALLQADPRQHRHREDVELDHQCRQRAGRACHQRADARWRLGHYA